MWEELILKLRFLALAFGMGIAEAGPGKTAALLILLQSSQR